MVKKYQYVSLFSGAGGLDIGLERAGLQATSLNEIEPVFCETLRVNAEFEHIDGRTYFDGALIQNADVRDLTASDIAGDSPIDIVVGGPPCQAFSSSGKQLSVLDSRGTLVYEFCRLIDELNPRIFLFENVRGLVTARDASGEPGGVIKGLVRAFGEVGYSCRAGLLNSADYGSYQRRVRCFIIGVRSDEAPDFPSPTHQKNSGLFVQPWRSLGEFLDLHEDTCVEGYAYPTKALAAQLSRLPDGCGVKSVGKKERTRPGGHWGYRQGAFIADQTLPARTVTGSSSQDWVRRNGILRRLTLSEVKQLQGFPRDWNVRGSKLQQFRQVGNAVPSVFGELLGTLMAEFLDNYQTAPPVKLDLPASFKRAIQYTKRDHERNKEARNAHKHFEGR